MKFDWNDLLFYEHKMVQGTVISWIDPALSLPNKVVILYLKAKFSSIFTYQK